MFKPGTVFIVGAGASVEAGLPESLKLKENIKDALTSKVPGTTMGADEDLFVTLQNQHISNFDKIGEDRELAQKMVRSLELVDSIDDFLYTYRDNPRIQFIGKLAIVRTILKGERESLLYTQDQENKFGFDLSRVNETWLDKFARILMSHCGQGEVSELFNNIDIICFNYDRCIEHYLKYAVAVRFDMSLLEAEKIVSNLRIYHPYGTVGNLPFEGLNSCVRFGDDLLVHTPLIEASKGIRTFNEDISSESVYGEIQDCMDRAKHLVFLGFGYHEQNMSLLRVKSDSMKIFDSVYGTAFDVSKGARSVYEERIRQLHSIPFPNFALDDLKCYNFFLEHEIELGA